jgi:DNA polymerase IV
MSCTSPFPAFPIELARVSDSSLRGRARSPWRPATPSAPCSNASRPRPGRKASTRGCPSFRARRFCPSLAFSCHPIPNWSPRECRPCWRSPVSTPRSGSRRLPGRLFLDLTGGRMLFGPGRDVAARLEREIERRLRLAGSVGVAGNKLISRIAAGYLTKARGLRHPAGQRTQLHRPLPVAVLPGVGSARESVLLQDLNLRRVEEVAALSVAQLRLAFGPFAPLLHQRSQGIDPSPVQPPKALARNGRGGVSGTGGKRRHLLLAELCRLVEGCGMRLRQLGQATRRLALTLTYADGVTEQGTASLDPHLSHDLALFAAVEELYYKTCRRRVRLRGCAWSAAASPPAAVSSICSPGAGTFPPRRCPAGLPRPAADQARHGDRPLGAQFRKLMSDFYPPARPFHLLPQRLGRALPGRDLRRRPRHGVDAARPDRPQRPLRHPALSGGRPRGRHRPDHRRRGGHAGAPGGAAGPGRDRLRQPLPPALRAALPHRISISPAALPSAARGSSSSPTTRPFSVPCGATPEGLYVELSPGHQMHRALALCRELRMPTVATSRAVLLEPETSSCTGCCGPSP